MSKKGQEEGWLVHAIFYLVLLVDIITIVYLLITGRFTTLWHRITDTLRFG